MKTSMSRLIHSSLPKLYAAGFSRNGRLLSTTVDQAFKVEEAETVNVPPPPSDKLLVLGGNGFVGSHVCKQALDRGLSVASLSRSGRSSIKDSWASNVDWHQGNLLMPDSLQDAMKGVTFVISCVGGVKRFVYVSAADFGLVNYLLQGYYEGKRAAETELFTRFPYGGVILRPGFIHGTRQVGSMKVPLGIIGAPMEMVLQHAKPLNRVPLVGPLFTPPVSVTAVAKVAVRAATDPVFPPGIMDVYGILRHSQ
ncbi:hypothetical protein IFM89_013846 [Coptis chinensis]|uniref:NAD-dependent epimerase/dehydratase domain-containing protein n=1 Tax=Coptis chinensis TaxID=261450 RepID=A0A835IVV3_9MAGN|nr:hypothetical protein IFM89_013846 [Coptis chinensis]